MKKDYRIKIRLCQCYISKNTFKFLRCQKIELWYVICFESLSMLMSWAIVLNIKVRWSFKYLHPSSSWMRLGYSPWHKSKAYIWYIYIDIYDWICFLWCTNMVVLSDLWCKSNFLYCWLLFIQVSIGLFWSYPNF